MPTKRRFAWIVQKYSIRLWIQSDFMLLIPTTYSPQYNKRIQCVRRSNNCSRSFSILIHVFNIMLLSRLNSVLAGETNGRKKKVLLSLFDAQTPHKRHSCIYIQSTRKVACEKNHSEKSTEKFRILTTGWFDSGGAIMNSRCHKKKKREVMYIGNRDV